MRASPRPPPLYHLPVVREMIRGVRVRYSSGAHLIGGTRVGSECARSSVAGTGVRFGGGTGSGSASYTKIDVCMCGRRGGERNY